MIRRPRVPAPEDFTAPSHSPLVAARLGLWLAVAFGLCFVTGLLSHYIQHPPGWFTWPTRPVNLYRVTQGVHVLSGVAAIPLLLAKLWSVYPRLFVRPPLRQPIRLFGHALEADLRPGTGLRRVLRTGHGRVQRRPVVPVGVLLPDGALRGRLARGRARCCCTSR